MKYKFYSNSQDAWEAMRQAIARARRYIYWEIFILIDDVPTHQFFHLLKEKAREGVSVKIILDSIGSFQIFSKLADEMRLDGVELLYFNELLPWWNVRRIWRWLFLRTHRKLLVVDGEVGFIGSVNVANKYRHWQELHLRVTGNIVRRFVKSFSKMYRICGGKDRIIAPPKKTSNAKLWLLEHWPWGKKSALKRYYKTQCALAEKRILIVTPYFVPQPWLLKALRKAIQRGVRVEVILPKTTDLFISDGANKVFMAIGHAIGINFFILPEMIHAKVFLVDEKEGLVGSQNINARSFDYDIESGVVFNEKNMLADLNDIVERWKSIAEPYAPPKEKWYSKLIAWIFKKIQPIL